MKALFSTIIATVLFFNFAIAQSGKESSHVVTLKVPTVALVNVVSTNPINLELVKPTTAGAWFDKVTDANSWLNVSSLVVANATRTISVEADDNVPDGLNLTVTADKVSSKGNLGDVAEAPIVLDGLGSGTLISEIKTGYTETGTLKGFQLTYELSVDNTDDTSIEALVSANTEITVTYTISE